MLKDKTLTYISLFSSAGVGCFGFKEAGYKCIATNEFIKRRLEVQRFNHKCDFAEGYICGDIKLAETKQAIFDEIKRYEKLGNDKVDVLIATPPCQGMSVANHKKTANEIDRNSLVVESIKLTKEIEPRFFVFENVASFLTTGCTAPDGTIKAIKEVIHNELADKYEIVSRVLNFKNYGSNSSRTRTLVIGVSKEYEEHISPIDLFPVFSKEKILKDVIGHLKPLEWGEIDPNDILHAFRTYPEKMREWISGLKEGESAFDNDSPEKRPHKIVDGVIVPNVRKNGDKYTRQIWEKVGPCIHTRNDQLASQNTIHPNDDRVFSLRELMLLMTIPNSFKWTDDEYVALNDFSDAEKRKFYKTNEINIRQSIGEAVPTIIFSQIAKKIKSELLANNFKVNVEKIIKENNLEDHDNLLAYINANVGKLSFSLLSRIAEMANGKRIDNNAYYTNKTLLNHIYEQMPKADAESIDILEPSVGVGNFLPYIFKKYEDVPCVNIDVVDIDGDSLEVLETLMGAIKVPENVNLNYIKQDYLLYETQKKYFLTIGNPPFAKVKRAANPKYFSEVFNDKTTNLCALFLEKAISTSEYVCMVQPKFVINTAEFKKTRELLSNHKINSIYDFGEKGFKGVLIETVCISIQVGARAGKTKIKHLVYGLENEVKQKELTSGEFPYWILYRNDFFDSIVSRMKFGVFCVFRDRQISNGDLSNLNGDKKVRVLKSRNVKDDGSIEDIPGYDSYIDEDILKEKTVYNYFNDDKVFLVPNMTYNPRMIKNPKGCTVNGSLAILIPKAEMPTEKQIRYFATPEYREFYKIARNYQTRSLNIDETSVFFFGLLEDE